MGLVIGIPLAYCIHRIFTCEEGKIFAIKELIAYYYIKNSRKKVKRRLDNYDIFSKTDLKKVNYLIPDEETVLEHRSNHPNSSDSIFFFGFNESQEKLLAKITVFRDHASVELFMQLDNGKQYSLPFKKKYKVPKTSSDCFVGGGLRLRCLVPFRKWRISFNGILKETSNDDESSKEVHVKFSFISTASSMPFDAFNSIPVEVLANYVAAETWNTWLPDLNELLEPIDSYEQSNFFTGTVSIDGSEEKETLLWGGRVRSSEPLEERKGAISTDYFTYMNEGDYVHINELTFDGSENRFRYGFIVHSNTLDGMVHKITVQTDKNDNVKIAFAKIENKTKFDLTVKTSSEKETKIIKELRNEGITFNRVEMDDDHGNCLVVTKKKDKKTFTSPVNLEHKRKSLKIQEFVFELGESECRQVELTGGKGSSLAELTLISHNNEKFTVPKGIVVTTFAYKKFLQSYNLQARLANLKFGEAEKVVTELSSKCLPSEIKHRIEEKLRSMFGDKLETTLFAVRSSASGEDSEDMSAAGQMETYLGVKGTDIAAKIVLCWASQFSNTAVQYKRQNGQELNSPMAVVIQEMVPADQAGVIFTCDPVTGNPQNITITANYGLGESVVSASAEPDTLVVQRNAKEELQMKSIQVGKKSTKITVTGGGGTVEKTVQEEEANRCSITEKNALHLARLAQEIEDSYGCPLDIEWAISQGNTLLLQARPVTTFDRETDYELIHETDVFHRCKDDYFTKANVGEVMPGAFSDLGNSFVIKMMDISTQDSWMRKDPNIMPCHPYMVRPISTLQKHTFFCLLDFFLRHKGTKAEGVTNAFQFSIFGRILEDENLIRMGIKRNKNYIDPKGWMPMVYLLIDFLRTEKIVQKAKKSVSEYNFTLDANMSSDEMFNTLNMELFKIATYGGCHQLCTFASVITMSVILTTLSKGNGGKWDEKVFSDFSLLVSSCSQVESAEVPNGMRELSSLIAKTMDSKEFKNMLPEDALKLLRSSDTAAGSEFKQFLNKHGHRCVKEFDVYTDPWGVDPLPLVKTLQEMVGIEKIINKPDPVGIKEKLSKLSIPLNWKSRLALRIFVPLGLKGVGQRERSKSVMIKVVDHFRRNFRIIANKMVEEGRLPNRDLFYFLSPYELDLLLKTRSSKLVQKAQRRKNQYKILDSYVFPEIVRGHPKPINFKLKMEAPIKGSLLIKGTAVSQGTVIAPVRVATTLEEASEIKPGEILIAYSTDIGWSPYFPLLGGVATELGGLISHGAVVAREYGLPCVVGVHGATASFRTGDRALLDGNKGILQRLDD